MQITDYASNSNKSKREAIEAAEKEQQEVEKRRTNDIVVRQSAGKKLWNTFIAEDLADIGRSIWKDYIVVGIKDAILAAVDMALGGDGYRPRSSSSSTNSYDRYYKDKRKGYSRDDDSPRRRLSYDDFTYRTRGLAEDIRRDLIIIMDKYDVVTISDFFDVLKDHDMEVDPHDRKFTDDSYGWYDLGPLEVVPVRGRYILKLPKAVPLD